MRELEGEAMAPRPHEVQVADLGALSLGSMIRADTDASAFLRRPVPGPSPPPSSLHLPPAIVCIFMRHLCPVIC